MALGHGRSRDCRVIAMVALMVTLFCAPARAQNPVPPPQFDNPANIPDIRALLPTATDSKGVSSTLQVLVLLTVLTLVPSILVMTTAFPRVIIVLGLLRQAMGTPQLPPGQVLLAISLFVTMLVMAPTWRSVQADVVTPYFEGKMSQAEAFDRTSAHLKDFMYRQIEQAGNYEEVYMFMEYANNEPIDASTDLAVADVPLTVMIPAFMLSELKTAFIMGFRIYLPFLVIDMVIATILISMGMMMLPPVLISLPFKLLLFVLADGWHLIVETLLYSYV